MTDLNKMPAKSKRPSNQIWIMSTDETPPHTFVDKPPSFLLKFNNIFHWTMTYRMASEIPVPYGRTVLKHESVTYLDDAASTGVYHKKVHVVAMISHCNTNNQREAYIAILKKYIPVDLIGACGNKSRR